MTDKSEKIKNSPPDTKEYLKVVSRLKHSVKLKYDNSTIVIPPQGKALDLDPKLLESELPQGVFSIKYTK